MAITTQDGTRINRSKEWKGKIAYDKTKDSRKVRALQRLLYGSTYQNAANNANIDGKFGENTKRHMTANGIHMADDWSYYIDKYNKKHVWDEYKQDYIYKEEAPKTTLESKPGQIYHPGNIIGIPGLVGISGLTDEEAANRGEGWTMNPDMEGWTDLQYRDMANFLKAHPGATEQDYINHINNMHAGNMSQIEAAKVTSDFVNTLTALAIATGSKGGGSKRGVRLNARSKAAEAPSKVVEAEPADEFIQAEPNFTPGSVKPASVKPASVPRGVSYYEYPPKYYGDFNPRIFDWLGDEYMKQGGKFQQGGKMSALQQILSNEQAATVFSQFLSQQSGKQITPEVLVNLVQSNPQALEQLEPIAQQFLQQMATSAKNGAKLSYIKRLRGKCPEGQELSYYMNGGKTCSKCVAAQKGVKVESDDDLATVAEFKRIKKQACGGKTKKK